MRLKSKIIAIISAILILSNMIPAGTAWAAEPANISNTHTVTFMDWDGTVLKTQTVHEGSGATAPGNPLREGYAFNGWDKAYNIIINDLTVTAQYTARVPGPVGTGSITGRVSHGSLVEGAEVSMTVDGAVYSATTDSLGSFTLTGVPEGTGYTVTFSKSGFADETCGGISVAADQNNYLGFITLYYPLEIYTMNSQTALSGQTVTFKISVKEGKPQYICQWKRDGVIVATHTVYSINYVGTDSLTVTASGASRGNYTAMIMDAHGDIVESSAVLSLTDDITSYRSGFAGPSGIVVDSGGNIIFSTFGALMILKIDGTVAPYIPSRVNIGNMAMDSAGNIYSIGGTNITKMSPDGSVTTVSTGLNMPWGIAVDSAGNVYVTDSNIDTNNLKKISPNLSGGYTTTIIAEGFSFPAGVAVDGSGNLYVADNGNNKVEKLAPNASGGYDVTPWGSGFFKPYGVAADSAGNVYVADNTNSSVKRINTSGTVDQSWSTNIPDELLGITLDSSGNIYVTGDNANTITKIIPADNTVVALALGPGAGSGVAVDAGGNIYVADTFATGVSKMIAGGAVDTLIIPAGIAIRGGIAVDSSGNVYASYYVNSSGSGCIMKVAPDKTVVTLVQGLGNGITTWPEGVAVDGSGYVYTLVDGTVKKINPDDSTVTDFASGFSSLPNCAYGIAVDSSGYVYVADTGNNLVKKLGSDGNVVAAYSGFSLPRAVTVDDIGNIYVADTGNNAIKKISPDGIMTVIDSLDPSGNYYTADNGSFYAPTGIAVDGTGKIYVTDSDMGVKIFQQYYGVIYNGNGNSSGSAPTDVTNYVYGQSATVLGNTGSLVKNGFSFNGWNTKPDGSGTAHAAGDNLNLTLQNVTLYAQWNPAPAYTATVTVNKDGSAWSSGAPAITIGTDIGSAVVNGTALANGTYSIYANGIDTGVDITVNDAAATATLNYYTLTLTAGTGIASISGNGVYLFGANASIDAVVSSGYIWEKWSDNNATKARTLTISSTLSLTASATLTPPTFVAITGITGVPATATVGVDLTLNGTVAPANATKKTIVWSVKTAGDTGATISGSTLFTTAAGTVIITATITNGLTESSDYTQDFNITVNPASVVNAAISPNTGSFDKYAPADVLTTVTWGSATGIADVKVGGISIGAGNYLYSYSGNTLTIDKDYLAAQAIGSLILTVEFNAGTAATLTIDITDNTPPIISPTSRNYDLNAPADVLTAITWNSASSVTDVVYSVSPDTTIYTLNTGDYTIVDDALTVKNSFFSGLSVTTGSALDFDITFNTGAAATLTAHIVNGYIPSNNTNLSRLTVNGTPVGGFDPNVTIYNVELPYGASVATVTAAAAESTAQVDITQAPSLPGSATVTVMAENGTSKPYTINFTIGAASTVPVSSITVTGTGGADSVQVGSTLQLLADVLPANATDNSVTWSIENGSGATINASGLLAATAEGSVTVRATANDSSGVYGQKVITITAAPPAFVAVTSITGVPNTATAGAPLTLTGMVAPVNATKKTIVWSIQNAGTTGAMISGNTLSTTAAGTVIVRANITNGASESTNYTQDFSITVITAPVTIYTVTASAGSGGSISPSRAVSVVSDGSQIFTVTPGSGYRISAVTVDGAGQGAITTYTFTNVTANHTINATFTRTSGGGGGGTPSTPATPEYKAEVKEGNSPETTLPVTINKDNGTASIDTGSQSPNQGGIVITIPSIPDVDTYSVGISVPSLSTTDGQSTLTINTDAGSITVPSDMLTGVSGVSGSKAEISIGQGDKDNLPDDVKAAIGDKPLISLSLSLDGKQTDWSNPSAPVTVSIPYTPTAAELANPESIVVWYIDGSGNFVTVPNGHYDPATGMVTFETTHFSDYAVAYNVVSFNDVAVGAWYSKAVSFIAAREITSGTGNGNYSPDAKLTRGEFIVLMMKAYGITPDTAPADNFADAGNTYYTGYLAAAKRLGITAGVGNNMYAPGKEITRQEMFTLLYNALKVIGQLPQGDSGKTLSDFTDAGQIDAWAKDAMTLLVKTGTVGGNAGKLTPTGTSTRAEMAQVLYNLLWK